jgi:anthranilate synthase component 2
VIFVLDNYDSFTFNLVQYLGELGAEPVVRRNDAATPEEVVAMNPEGIVISPGPGTPADAGISIPLVRAAAQRGVPLLGVCLGHQAIGEAFGGRVVRARRLMHGKTSQVRHTRQGVLQALPSPFTAMRYHSLVVEKESLPGELEATAWSADEGWGEELMAMRHRSAELHGVQFHPESIGTPEGKLILRNFLEVCARAGQGAPA